MAAEEKLYSRPGAVPDTILDKGEIMCRMTINNVNKGIATTGIYLQRGKDKKTLYWVRGGKEVKIEGVKLNDRVMEDWVRAAKAMSVAWELNSEEPANTGKYIFQFVDGVRVRRGFSRRGHPLSHTVRA